MSSTGLVNLVSRFLKLDMIEMLNFIGLPFLVRHYCLGLMLNDTFCLSYCQGFFLFFLDKGRVLFNFTRIFLDGVPFR